MKKPKFITEFRDIPAGRTKMPELELDQRKLSFSEVELGFTEELARKEAARCLSCRRCIGCGLCLAECDQCAIVYDEKESSVTLEADGIVFTSDGDVFDAGRKRELGYRDAWNVITSFEFERLSSATGPFGGLILRPFDGELPKRIAFIQCVGSRDEALGANYCSVECCSRTFSQARRAHESAGDVEVWMFHKGLRPSGKRSEVELRRISAEKWIKLVEGTVASVKEDAETGSVAVRYARDGKESEERFDLVVLAVAVQSKRDFRRHARVGGVGVNKHGFIDAGVANVIACKEGVAFAGAIRGPQEAAGSVTDAIAAASRALGACEGNEAAAPAEESGAKALVYACEYGLQLAGRDRAWLENLKRRGLEIAGVFPFLCYKAGRDALRQALAKDSRLVVLGCHRGSHEELFERLLGLGRDAVAILGGADLAGDVEKALASLAREPGPTSGRAPAASTSGDDAPGSARGQRASSSLRTVAILGGGAAGLAAAGELVRKKVKVVVIEKFETLGASLARATITSGPAEAKVVADYVAKLEANPDVRILRFARPSSLRRDGANLKLGVSTPDGNLAVEAGAVLIATGAAPFDPAGLGLGEAPGTITQADLRASLTNDDAHWQKLVMLQCVGARDAKHPYCSRYCCREALINALAFKHANPEAEVTILHRGMRLFGPDEELYTDAVERRIAFIELDGKTAVRRQGGETIGDRVRSPVRVVGTTREGKYLDLASDVLVLSLAHGGNGDNRAVADLAGLPLDELGFFQTANPLLEPFATPARGIFACGFARGPVSVEEAFVEGLGAAGAICRYLEKA